MWTVYLIASTNASAVLAAQLYRGGFFSSRPCVTANGEQRAPSSFAYALTRTPSLNDIPSGSSFVYSDRCIFWWLLVSEQVFKPDAFCSRMFYQSLRRHIRSTAFWKWGGWRIFKRGAFPHWFTNLWGLHPFLPTCCLLTLPRQWLRNQGIGALRLPFSMGTSVKSLVLLGLRHSSTSADTHSQVDLRRSSRLSVRIIRLFSVSRRGALHWEARKLYFNPLPFRGNPCRGVAEFCNLTKKGSFVPSPVSRQLTA